MIGSPSGASQFAAVFNLNGPGHYVHWGFVQLSLANFIVIALIVIVFWVALVLPFPPARRQDK